MEQAQEIVETRDVESDFGSAFMKRKVELESIVSSLDRTHFFDDI